MAIRMNKIEYLILHHSGVETSKLNDDGHYQSMINTLRNRHGNKFKAEYHYFIGESEIFQGQPEGEVCPHAGFDIGEARVNNWNALGVCCAGNYEDEYMKPYQQRLLVAVVKKLVNKYKIPSTKILRHKDLLNTLCPGKNFPFKQVIQEVYNMKSFPDVDQSRWSYEGIKYAVESGIMTGDTDGKFYPERPLTREELCVVLKRLHDKGVI